MRYERQVSASHGQEAIPQLAIVRSGASLGRGVGSDIGRHWRAR